MKREHRTQLIVFATVAAAFCVGGVVLLVLGFRSYGDSRAFAAGASAAEGDVVGFETWESGTGFDERDNIHYAVVVYRAAEGREVRFRGPSRDGLVRLARGDKVRVLYHPNDPENARVDSFMGLWFAATMLWIVGGGAVVIPPLTLWQAWKWAKRQGGTDETNGKSDVK